MNADGSGQRRLTRNQGDHNPAWSPDGRRIAFIRDQKFKNQNSSISLVAGATTGVQYWADFEVYVMNADGSGQRQLTQNGGGDPAWSPDGRRIAFTSYRIGNSEVYLMNADGSGQRQLTRYPAQDGSPAWSPDGRRIAFSRSPADCGLGFCDREVYLMNADGSGQRNLTRIPSAHEEDPAWSPVALVVPVADGGAAAAKARPLPPKLVGQWTHKFTAADGKRTGLGPQGWGEVWTLTIEKSGAVSVSIPSFLQGGWGGPFTGLIVSVGENRVRVSVYSFVVVYSWRVSGRLLTLTKSASTAGLNTFYLGVWKRT